MSGDTFPTDLDSTTGEEVVVGFWARYWRGQGRLVIAFWIIGVIGAIVLNVVQQVMIALGLMLYYFEKAGASTVTPLIYAAFGLWIVYAIYASVSIWRCAFNTSWPAWGYLARGCVILVLTLTVLGALLR